MHPYGLALLGASVALAFAMFALPALRQWSDRALLILALGALAYSASAGVALFSRPDVAAPELRKLRAIRQAIATRLAERQAAERRDGPSELTAVLSEAIVHLDDDVIPALQQLVERQRVLGDHLSRYERG